MKREKYPPLKPWQLEVVKKHETRRRLLNGSPFDVAKYWFMKIHDLNEKEFDDGAQQYIKTFGFNILLIRQNMIAGLNDFANYLRRIFNKK